MNTAGNSPGIAQQISATASSATSLPINSPWPLISSCLRTWSTAPMMTPTLIRISKTRPPAPVEGMEAVLEEGTHDEAVQVGGMREEEVREEEVPAEETRKGTSSRK